ncbi:hypothetical protein M918_03215 [Clostridium sp. BL8]|nr:hypothetical protein M918_03215 [Clostridium sp. BL8]
MFTPICKNIFNTVKIGCLGGNLLIAALKVANKF